MHPACRPAALRTGQPGLALQGVGSGVSRGRAPWSDAEGSWEGRLACSLLLAHAHAAHPR